jgi:hypothetical protein
MLRWTMWGRNDGTGPASGASNSTPFVVSKRPSQLFLEIV